jgi:DNA-directed RNA polymerase specialized sigma24 family protein
MQISQATENSVSTSQLVEVSKVWSRWEDGSEPIRVFKKNSGHVYALARGDSPEIFTSGRALTSAITGKAIKSAPSFRSYFRTGPEGDVDPPSILSFFDAQGSRVVAAGLTQSLKTSRIVGVTNVRVLKKSRVTGLETPKLLDPEIQALIQDLDQQLWSFQTERDQTLIDGLDAWVVDKGIDLTAQGKYAKTLALEVRKILHAKFYGLMASQGYDPDEVLQEVYKGILTRNYGKCPWDRRKATFGYYVHMVIKGVLINYHRKQGRRQDRNPASLDNLDFFTTHSPTTGALSDGQAYTGLAEFMVEHKGTKDEGRLAIEILPWVSQGMTRREIVGRTGHKETAVAKALSHLRRVSRLWAAEVGVSVR